MGRLALEILNTIPNSNPQFETTLKSLLWDLESWRKFIEKERGSAELAQ